MQVKKKKKKSSNIYPGVKFGKNARVKLSIFSDLLLLIFYAYMIDNNDVDVLDVLVRELNREGESSRSMIFCEFYSDGKRKNKDVIVYQGSINLKRKHFSLFFCKTSWVKELYLLFKISFWC
jgi:hypothetical protein